MPNSYLVIGILAVMGIILSLIWVRNATFKGGQIDKIKEDESYKWAKKWNEQWCDSECCSCEENDNCPFTEVQI